MWKITTILKRTFSIALGEKFAGFLRKIFHMFFDDCILIWAALDSVAVWNHSKRAFATDWARPAMFLAKLWIPCRSPSSYAIKTENMVAWVKQTKNSSFSKYKLKAYLAFFVYFFLNFSKVCILSFSLQQNLVLKAF